METDCLFHKMVGMMLVLMLLVGCTQLAAPLPTTAATATHDSSPEDTATAKANQQSTAQAEETAKALVEEAAQGTANAQATLDVQSTADFAASATAAHKTQTMEAVRARNTQVTIEKATATAEAQLAATAQAQPMYETVQQLYADGVIASMEGEFTRASDFDQSWAQLNWYDMWPVVEAYNMDTSHFVVRADFWWDSASDNANWNQSGCGFAMYDLETKRHHFVFLGMDGYANLLYNDGGRSAYYKAKKLTDAKSIPQGEAEFVLAVQDQTITVYVNGEQAFSYTEPIYKPGVLVYSLVSGSNKDFGTRCKMTNVGLWAMRPVE